MQVEIARHSHQQDHSPKMFSKVITARIRELSNVQYDKGTDGTVTGHESSTGSQYRYS